MQAVFCSKTEKKHIFEQMYDSATVLDQAERVLSRKADRSYCLLQKAVKESKSFTAFQSSTSVFAESFEQNLLSIGIRGRADALMIGTGFFHIPDGGFAECMIAPVPVIILEDLDEVPQILRGSRRPGDGGKFADVDAGSVAQLEIADRLKNLPQFLLIELFSVNATGVDNRFFPGPEFAILRIDALMGELKRLIHVNFIDDVQEINRFQQMESVRRVGEIGGNDDRPGGVDFANLLRRLFLQRQEVVFGKPFLVGFIDESVAPHGRIVAESTRDPFPELDKIFGVAGLVEHRHLPVGRSASRVGVKINDKTNAVLFVTGAEHGFKVIEFAIDPAVELLQIAVGAHLVPVADDLSADQIDVPASKRGEII